MTGKKDSAGGQGHNAETAQALEIAMGDYRVTGDAEALQQAARAHLDASRPLEDVAGEYRAVAEAAHSGEDYDAEEFGALGTELTFTRQAGAIASGSLPGTGHSASAGIGD